jgi:hypothetical protein
MLRLFDANVYEGNPSIAGYGREIRQDRPDLVTLIAQRRNGVSGEPDQERPVGITGPSIPP